MEVLGCIKQTPDLTKEVLGCIKHKPDLIMAVLGCCKSPDLTMEVLRQQLPCTRPHHRNAKPLQGSTRSKATPDLT